MHSIVKISVIDSIILRILSAAVVYLMVPGDTMAVPEQSAELNWHNVTPSEIEGQGWKDTEEPFDRLPARAKNLVREPVWNLARHSAGIYVDFVTDATTIAARWTLSSDRLEMYHMPSTGVSGVDLYTRHDDGNWYFVGNGWPRNSTTREATIAKGLEGSRAPYRLYFPLYNGVTQVELAVPEGATFEFTEATDPRVKPVVIYGTSITQGGCASRPGLSYPAILGRRLNVPVINLGFSGNGKAEPEVAQLVAELDPSVFVLDPLGNLFPAQVAERLPAFIEILREHHPDVPIMLCENVIYPTVRNFADRRQRVEASNKFLNAIYDERVARGDRNIYRIPASDLTSDFGDTTVDGTHPSDLGFLRMADTFEPHLRKVLEQSEAATLQTQAAKP